MNLVLSATAPIFLTVALGFLASRLRWLSPEQFVGMGAFVMRIALPALILNTFAGKPMREIADAHFLLVYGLGCMGVLLGAFALFRYGLGIGTAESAIRALGTANGNSGFVGFPIALQVVGATAGVGVALCMLVENILVIPIALAIAEAGAGEGGSLRRVLASTAGRLLRMPLILSIIAGFAISALDVRFPEPITRTLSLLAGASAPLALLVLGGSLAGLKARGVAWPAFQIVIGKLVVLPLAIVGLTLLIPIGDPALRKALLIYAASPMLSIYPIVGARFGLRDVAAAALLGATVGSFVTISTLLWLIL